MTTKLIRPVEEPSKVTSPFGRRVINGEKQFHDGIDYASKTNGLSVLAITDGVVTYDKDNYQHSDRFTDPADSAGNFVILKHLIHGMYYFVRYLHLGRNVVSIGQQVRRGDVLGFYGDYGYSYGPHVHLDMYTLNWVKINPTPIMLRGLRANGNRLS